MVTWGRQFRAEKRTRCPMIPVPAMPGPEQNALPLEVRLLVSALHWPPSAREAASLQELAAAAPDWEEVLALAAHHRVLPLTYRTLTLAGINLPPAVHAKWRSSATRNAYAAMRSLAETARLQNLLRTVGIATRVLKGVPLSLRAYGDPTLRDVGDIDLLIAPGQEGEADLLLTADGFERQEPRGRLTPRRRASYRKHAKDYTYAPGEAGFEVDLHWRLFRNPEMPGNALGAATAVTDIELGSEHFSTLPLAGSLLHLCVHGALDGWARLKSLADVAALWRQAGTVERDAVLSLARREDVIPELAAALLLACRLGLAEREELPHSLLLMEGERTVTRILHHALQEFHQCRFRPNPAGLGSWSAKRYELGLRSGARYRFEILRRVLFRPRVWERFDLPDALFPLYAVLSPVEWLLFHLGHRSEREKPVRRGGHWWRRLRQNWTRCRQVRIADHLLLSEAGCMLVGARLALRLAPAGAILRWVRRGGSGQPGASRERAAEARTVERVCWAVLAATRHAPLRFLCFPQALAAHVMLRIRGVESQVIYGVRRSAEGKLRAHTWLRVGDRTVLGGETEPLFTPVDPWRNGGPVPRFGEGP